jgi:hypothetical protein
MKKSVAQYIQKLIALVIIGLGSLYASEFVNYLIIIPFSLLVYSFLIWQITNTKPQFLFNLKNVDTFINNKSSLWPLLKLFVLLWGFVYDIIVFVVWGIFLIFEIFADILLLLKDILFWITHAIIWFLKLFVPPIIFLYNIFIHYIIKWTWWSFQLAYRKVGHSMKFSYFIIGLIGAVLSLFLFFLFLYIDILIGFIGLVYVGMVLAILPVTWSYAEIASINDKNYDDEPYYEITSNFENGMVAVKNILFFILSFISLIIIQILLNLFNLIPSAGLSIGGIILNINTLISILLIFIFFILLFAKAVIPTHIIKAEEQETPVHNVIYLIKTIISKCLRYITTTIPTYLFGFITIIIPALIVFIAVFITFSLKNNMIESKIESLNKKKNETNLNEIQTYAIDKKIEKLNYYKTFPVNCFKDIFIERNLNNYCIYEIKQNIADLERKIEESKNNYALKKATYENKIAVLNNKINKSANEAEKLSATNELNNIKDEYNRELYNIDVSIKKLIVDYRYFVNLKKQIPVKLFFMVLWISLFGGLIYAFLIAYKGNVYYELYDFREDGESSYFAQQVEQAYEKDSKQLLLGFTLLILAMITLGILYVKL